MRSRTNKLRELFMSYWQPAVYYGMLIIFFGTLLWLQLGSLLGGYSADELSTLKASQSLRYILDHPLNMPFTIVAYLFQHVPFVGNDILAVRAATTVFALLTLTTFFWLVRYWHDEKTAILGTTIFGCSAWFLHIARFGTPSVLMFLLLTLAAVGIWLKHTDNRFVLLVAFGLASAMLYVPGMIWLLIVWVAWQGKTIFRLARQHFSLMAIGTLMMLVLISPLGWAIYRAPETAKLVAGLPAQGWPDVLSMLHNLASIPYNLVWHGPLDAAHWLGRLPLLDAFSIVMMVFGAYLYVRHWRLMRSKLVLASIVIGALLVSIGGMVQLPILMPFVYIFVAAGIGYMLDRWQRIFPRNTIAQTVGVALISIVVIMSSWYGLRHYFVAWPNAQATRQIFTIK